MTAKKKTDESELDFDPTNHSQLKPADAQPETADKTPLEEAIEATAETNSTVVGQSGPVANETPEDQLPTDPEAEQDAPAEAYEGGVPVDPETGEPTDDDLL